MIEEPTRVGYYAFVKGIVPSRGLMYFDGMQIKQLYTSSYPVYRSWEEFSTNLRVLNRVPDFYWEEDLRTEVS